MPNTVYYCSQPCCQAQSSDNNRPVPKQLACLTLYNALVQNTLPESAQSKAYQQLQAPALNAKHAYTIGQLAPNYHVLGKRWCTHIFSSSTHKSQGVLMML